MKIETRIRQICEGNWTLEELYTVNKQSNDLMDSVQHPVDVIVDLQKSMNIPRALMPEIRRMNETSHPHANRLVIVGGNRFIAILINTVQRVYRKDDDRSVQFVTDLEAAYAFLDSDE